MKTIRHLFAIPAFAFLLSLTAATAADKISVLIVDGQNNHAWAETTPILKTILEESGRFTVDVSTSPPAPPRPPQKPKNADEAAIAAHEEALKKWRREADRLEKENIPKWEAWRPAFADYDVVVSNYTGESWPEPVRTAFEEYVGGGGGFVVFHAADNAFPEWEAYNRMIGLGGWGGRTELAGPYLRLRDGEFVKDMTPGRGGAHGQRHEFVVVTRAPEHPVMKGLPAEWRHAVDELYGMMRGPAENLTVLASAFSDPDLGGSGEHEPVLMAIDFGKGRVFHTVLGHDAVSMSGAGFQETLKRGAEWAATGRVSFGPVSAGELPKDRAATREPGAAID